MIPLRIALLWHQHQPDYRLNNEFVLPWVGLHAAKDYANLALLFEQYPMVRHTMNVVPSLMEQLDDVAKGMLDPLQKLFMQDAASYGQEEVTALVSWLKTAQFSTMVEPLPRFSALWNRLDAAHTLSAQECTDLKVCFLLAWVGPMSRSLPTITSLLLKGALFAHSDVQAVLDVHKQLAADVVPILRRLNSAGVLELSTTPFHHPILPLLINSDVALQSSGSRLLPIPPIQRPNDARLHVQLALDSHTSRFGRAPSGMWPAEGAVSFEALSLLSKHGVRWAATDAQILASTLGEEHRTTSPFYPWEVSTPDGTICMLFRDRELSDAIGFSYATWNPQAAARDFLSRLEERRRIIVASDGEQALLHAVVPVILDGENCWEFYAENGKPFLEALLQLLSQTAWIAPVTCSEAASPEHCVAGPRLTAIHPGSWIDASFDVWIGSPSKNAAWTALGDVGTAVDGANPSTPIDTQQEFLAAQASDTFWWYHDRHAAPHKHVFDKLFRQRLSHVLEGIRHSPFDCLSTSFHQVNSMDNETVYPVHFSGGATHAADVVSSSVSITTQDAWQRLTIAFHRWPAEHESVTLIITDRHGQERSCLISADGGLLWQSPLHDEGCAAQEMAVLVYLRAASQWKVKIIEDVGPTRTAEMDVQVPLME